MVNIFITDYNPVIAASESCDSYVVKIPIEVATMLSAIHWRLEKYQGPVGSGLPLVISKDGHVQQTIGPYKNSNVIKSTSETYQWLIKSTGNYDYAIKYGLELIEEYKRRYNKLHKTEGILLWLKNNVPKTIPEGTMTMDIGLAMPEIYKDRNDPVQSYRNYLFYEKSKILKWKYTKRPEWYEKMKIYNDLELSIIELSIGRVISHTQNLCEINMIFTVKGKDNLIQLREFDINISPYYRHEFMEFAGENYSTIEKVWIHEDIEFTAFIESGTWRVIGLLVAVPNFGIKQVHIRFIAVAEDYRSMGLGTKLLALIASKYRRLEITLNIELDRLDLLDFYCKTGYAVQKEVIKGQNIMILSLVHINVLAKIVLG